MTWPTLSMDEDNIGIHNMDGRFLSTAPCPYTIQQLRSRPDYTFAIEVTSWVFCLLNTIGALTVLICVYLLLRNKRVKLTGYLLVIVLMSGYEILYDASHIFSYQTCRLIDCPNRDRIYAFYIFMNTFGGIGTFICSLILSISILIIIKFKRSVDLKKYFWLIGGLLGISSFSVACYFCISYVNDASQTNYTRIFTITTKIRLSLVSMNIIVSSLLHYFFLRKTNFLQLFSSKRSKSFAKTLSRDPVFVLVIRMSLYPLVHIASRIPNLVLTTAYADTNFATPSPLTSTAYTSWYFLSKIMSPMGGLGDMLIFLFLQEEAYNTLSTALLACFGIKKTSTSRSVSVSHRSRNPSTQSDFTAHSHGTSTSTSTINNNNHNNNNNINNNNQSYIDRARSRPSIVANERYPSQGLFEVDIDGEDDEEVDYYKMDVDSLQSVISKESNNNNADTNRIKGNITISSVLPHGGDNSNPRPGSATNNNNNNSSSSSKADHAFESNGDVESNSAGSSTRSRRDDDNNDDNNDKNDNNTEGIRSGKQKDDSMKSGSNRSTGHASIQKYTENPILGL